MTESLRQKLTAEANKCYEKEIAKHDRLIQIYDVLKNFPLHRKSDPELNVRYGYEKIVVSISRKEFCAKEDWLLMESLLDAVEIPMDMMYEHRTDSLFWLYNDLIDITFSYSTSCTAIYKTVQRQEVVGYKCS